MLLYLDIVKALNSPNYRMIFSVLEARDFSEEASPCFAECVFWIVLGYGLSVWNDGCLGLSRGFPQGATPSPRVFNILFDLVHTIACAGGLGGVRCFVVI